MNERFQRNRRHRCVMLKHRMQSKDSDPIGGKQGSYSDRLWQAMGNTSGAKHLECLYHNHLASKFPQGKRLIAVEPLRDRKFWSGLHLLHPCSLKSGSVRRRFASPNSLREGYSTLPERLRSPDATSKTSVTHSSGA